MWEILAAFCFTDVYRNPGGNAMKTISLPHSLQKMDLLYPNKANVKIKNLPITREIYNTNLKNIRHVLRLTISENSMKKCIKTKETYDSMYLFIFGLGDSSKII